MHSPKHHHQRDSPDNISSPGHLDYEQKRGKIILEIYETEQIYQRLLAEFIEVFLRDLESGDNEQARAFMSRPNLAGLCSNIEQISHLSQQLRGELNQVLDDAGALDDTVLSPLKARRAAKTAIGPIFKRFASLLQLYEQYVENHAFARDDIDEFLVKPAFQMFWKKCADVRSNAKFASQQQLESNNISSLSAMTPPSILLSSAVTPTTNFSTTNTTYSSSSMSTPGSRLKKQSTAESISSNHSNTTSGATSPNMIPGIATTLDGYLILPIQRVPRYVLLLKELHRVTEKICKEENNNNSPPSSPKSPIASDSPKTQSRLLHNRIIGGQNLNRFYAEEVIEIQHAFKLVSDAAVRMNEAIRGSESSQMMRELQSRFIGASIDLVGTGRMSTRTLIREGELMRVTQKSNRHKSFHFHLLSDMLLYSELLTGGGLKLHRYILLDGTCKVFSNVPLPSGSQYENYGAASPILTNNPSSVNTPNTSLSKHIKRPSLKLRNAIGAINKSPQQTPTSPTTDSSPDGATTREGDSAGSDTTFIPNRAFQVATHMKTVTLYASTMAEKEAWVKDIKNAIRELAKSQTSHVPPSNSTLFSAEEQSLQCKICGSLFSLLKRKHNCKRCGVLTCADCCNRKRIFTKATPQRCCDICRLEMDLTARDDQPFRFRIFCQIKSITGLGGLARGDDRKDPLSRCYFALTQRSTKKGPGMRRGPTSVGHEASFMVPIGPCVEEEDSAYWVLRVYLLTLGEVGTITFDVRELMCNHEMRLKKKFSVSYSLKGPLVDEFCEANPPTIALSFELMMPPALWLTPDMEIELEKELQRVSQNLNNNNKTNIDLNHHVKIINEESRRNRSTSSGNRIAENEEEKANDDEDVNNNLTDEEDEAFKFTVEARLRRYEGDEDEDDDADDNEDREESQVSRASNAIEFANNDDERRERNGSLYKIKRYRRPKGKLNVTVYAMYEKIAKERPSFWTIVCVRYLYTDTALRLTSDESDTKKISADALASLQERHLIFSNNPTIRKVWEAMEESTNTSTNNDIIGRERKHSNSSLSNRNSYSSTTATTTTTTTNANNFISHRALAFFEQSSLPPSSSAATTPKSSPIIREKRGFESRGSYLGFSGNKRAPSSSLIINNDDNNITIHPRSLVLQDLLRTEKAYIASLEILDEVFITPLMQVAHGASANSVKQGVQFSRGNGGAQHIQTTNNASGILSVLKLRKDVHALESKAVANAVKQPDVTVLLQSVRQILTINKQLLRDLQTRLNTIDYSKCIGDIFCRFAVVLKVYNAYATNHLTVEKILTPRDVPIFSNRKGSSTNSTNNTTTTNNNNSLTKRTTSSTGSNTTTNNPTPSDNNNQDDDGEGPSESLINFVKILEEDERCEGRSFVQLLRLPKERLNRYKRILTSLLMHTPDDHNDAELLRNSLKLLDQSEKHISWSVRRRFNLEKLQDIQKSFAKLPFHKTVPPLVSARRWFKKEGYLVKRCRRNDRLFRFWLFNDSLVYGSRSRLITSGYTYKFCRFLMLKDMTVHDLHGGVDKRSTSDSNPLLGDNRFAFEIRSPAKSFVVMIPLIMYEKPKSNNILLDSKSAVAETMTNLNEQTSIHNSSSSGGVNELASDEMKKKLKDDWLREILQCIHDIHEDDEVAPERSGVGETTDSLFKKTESHNKKIDEKAAPVWAHDDSSNNCSQCPNKFTLTFRRHHCRSCGALVCDPCSKARIVLENIHPVKKQRVCKRCIVEMNEDDDDD